MSLTTPVRTPRDRLDRLTSILSRVFRFWWVAGIVLGIGAGASLAAATLKKRVYTSETVLLYREGIRATYVLGRDAEGEATRKLGLRLKEMVLARPRLKDIIDEFGLYKETIDKRGYIEAIDTMRTNIDFKVREGDTFLLAFTDKDPEVAQKVAARLSQALIDENSKYRSRQAETTKDFIGQEKKRTEDELRSKEQALAGFLTRHPEFAQDQGGQGGASGGAAVRAAEKRKDNEKPSGADPELLALEREASRLRQRLSMPAAPRAPSSPPQRDPRLVAAKQEAEAELLSANRDLADKQGRLTDQHPDVMAAKSRVKIAQDRYKKSQDALASGEIILPAEVPPASEAERPALEAKLNRLEAEAAAVRRRKLSPAANQAEADKQSTVVQEIVDLETDWARLNRDVADARERYQNLEGKEFVANMAASSEETGQAAQIDVVDPAFKPTRPAGGGRMKVLLMGMLASMALAGAIVLACAIFDDRLYEPADVEGLELGALLVSVPRAARAAGRGKRG